MLAPVPGKQISGNLGLNIANHIIINFIAWLDSVPDSMMKPNLGGQLTHQSVKNKQNGKLVINNRLL